MNMKPTAYSLLGLPDPENGSTISKRYPVIAYITIIVCLGGIIAQLWIGNLPVEPSNPSAFSKELKPWFSMQSISAAFAIAVVSMYIAGPLVVHGGFAWWQRGSLYTSITLLVMAIGIALWSSWIFVDDYQRAKADPDYARSQRLVSFVVPLLQWMVVSGTGASLLLKQLIASLLKKSLKNR